MKKSKSFIRNHLLTGTILFTAIFMRFVIYGFKYFPQLDDYIQYGKYSRIEHPWDMINAAGLLGARPLSNTMDFVFWSKMWGFLILAVVIVCILYAISAMLFRSVFSRYFKVGYIFYAVYALLPFTFEGVYWLSASTRTVCGLFYTALALYAFVRFWESGRIRWLILAVPVQFAAFASYEQSLILCTGLVCLIALCMFRKYRWRSLSALFSFSNAAIYFAITNHFSKTGLYAGTYHSLIFPNEKGYFTYHLVEVLRQLIDVFGKANIKTLTKGFVRGASAIVSDNLWIYAIALIAVAVIFFFTAKGSKPSAEGHSSGSSDYDNTEDKPIFGPIAAIAFSVIIGFIPLLVFFVQRNVWISLRAAIICLPGIALFADTILCMLSRKRSVAAALASCMILWFGIASVSEMKDYRDTYKYDNAIVTAMLRDIPYEENQKLKIGLLNLESNYLTDQNYSYHEHIHGVTESTWALTGAYTAIGEYPTDISITLCPLKFKEPVYSAWNASDNALDSFDKIYIYNEDTVSFEEVSHKITDEGNYIFFDSTGKERAIVEISGSSAYGSLIGD